MDRITQTFAAARDKGRACFISYLCAGDPDFDTSYQACRKLTELGVDVLELGMPFSDPLADGNTNQLAAQRSLESGMNQAKVFELIRKIRAISEVPIVLYTYYNLVYSQGVEPYLKMAKDAGVDGLLTLDLPPEEAADVIESCRKIDLKNIFLVAPTTPPQRIEFISKFATGFIYYLSVEGVTGERVRLADNIKEAVTNIKKYTQLPVAVGLGISTADQVRDVASSADGVIVGSALVNCIASNPNEPELILKRLSNKLSELLGGLA